ncbi:response regulator [Altericroceibacterium xinjiangense]|uniref:response regulator n=1 Tax=Altericroceibacterium xinjiangense TaxID=762261 RepID=UPI000F7DBBA6|nr:response regulator [Altericroceibacterium xinjiangense]
MDALVGLGEVRDLRVLLLEDSRLDADLIEAQLHQAGLSPSIERVWTREHFEEALERKDFDVILADHVLPRFDGDAALELAAVRAPEIPFIFVSGTLDEELAVQAMKCGATDFVVKQRLHRLADVVKRAMGELRERTERRRAEEELRRANQRLDAILDNTQMAVFLLNDRQRCIYANAAAEQLTGYRQGELQGRPLQDIVQRPSADAGLEFPMARAFLEGSRVEGEAVFLHRDGHAYPVAFAASPLREQDGKPAGTVVEARNIADEKARDAALRISEDRLRLATEAADIGTWDLNPLTRERRWDTRCKELFGLKPTSEVSFDTFLAGIHPDDRVATEAAVQRALSPHGPGEYQVEYRTIGLEDGVERWVAAIGRAFFEGEGDDQRAARFIGTMIDISEPKRIEQALREEGRRLETLNRTGAALAGELDLERLVQMVTDAGVELTGASFGAFFYSVPDEEGESFMLHALSGVTSSEFDVGMPHATALLHPTFAGDGPVRSADITNDPRYGRTAPHFGMPKGHLPVRSYLAVPVKGRLGEVMGGLFFGHREPGQFSERHEQLMTGIAAQAAIALDNAHLFETAQRELAERTRIETAVRDLNETLEQRVAEEVARRSEMEDALRQAQKMETLGQLTGGVAHDFNNLLQVVIGNLDLLRRKLPEDAERLKRAADNAMNGAERAAVLTQRLLAFSRRQPLAPETISANDLVTGMSELLFHSLGETIEYETVLAPDLWQIEADPNQLENALLNLAVNARDATPEGGKLTIETANARLDDEQAGAPPGEYVAISVSDTGSGMDPEMLNRVFEPFFTTKEVGKGTGLGLSMVYGFVQQSGGHVRIDSEPGEGTTVRIYLPRYEGEGAARTERREVPVPERAQEETILVCEDDQDVRAYSVEILRELGYRVLEAHDGPSALHLLDGSEEQVDLLFTDIVLPSGMTGAVLADRARHVRPDLKVLFTTGYARNAIMRRNRLDPGVELIAKPFAYADLAARVRHLLDGPK